MKKIKKFYEELYIGFVHYGKNFYSDDFSKSYGEILLFICFFVITMPLITLIVRWMELSYEIFKEKIFGFSFSFIIIIFLSGIIVLSQVLYLHSCNRMQKIIERYMNADKDIIKELKRQSGSFAVISFLIFLFELVVSIGLYRYILR